MKKILIPLLLFLLMRAACANVIITGTRIIYPGNNKEISIRLNNPDDYPALVQTWIDSADAEDADAPVPFVLSPPIFRMEPKTGQILRLFYTGDNLPEDRESLYYFNVLDIPPKPDMNESDAPQNYLQFSIRSRLKLFFRPAGLSPDAADAPAQIRWLRDAKNSKRLTIVNPTPYFVTFHALSLRRDNKKYPLPDKPMIAPFEQAEILLPQSLEQDMIVDYETVNDFGGISSGSAAPDDVSSM